MANVSHFTYPSADRRTQIHAMQWRPEGEPAGIMQIVHGMQEFIDRYDEFARFLCDEMGFLVVGNDHLGHGKSIVSEEEYGFFAEKGGNKAVIADIRELQRQVQLEFPEVPCYMLGHSMGSFLARQYLCLYGQYLDGAIISGTAWHTAFEANLGMTLCTLLAKRKGWHYRSPFITGIAMGNYNKRFEPVRTNCDWLTRDTAIVDAYVSDPRTQFMFTLNGFYNMFAGLKFLTVRANLEKMPKDLPVLFIAGEMDPVGNYGTGVKKTAVSFRSLGMKDVECRIYPNDRHEVLNELDRQDVYKYIRKWLLGSAREE